MNSSIDQRRIDDILAPVGEAETTRRERRVRARFWETFRRAARHIPFGEDLAAAYYSAIDPRTPARVRGILLAALAYFVLPFDLVPDFIAFFGFTDDVAVITAALAAVRPHIKPRHYKAAREALKG